MTAMFAAVAQKRSDGFKAARRHGPLPGHGRVLKCQERQEVLVHIILEAHAHGRIQIRRQGLVLFDEVASGQM
jgi:hypothetical protein